MLPRPQCVGCRVAPRAATGGAEPGTQAVSAGASRSGAQQHLGTASRSVQAVAGAEVQGTEQALTWRMRSRERMRMPLHALRASSHRE